MSIHFIPILLYLSQGSIDVSNLAGLVEVHQHDGTRATTDQQQTSITQASTELGHALSNLEPLTSPRTSYKNDDVEAAGGLPVKRRKVVGGLRPMHSSSRRAVALVGRITQPEEDRISPSISDTPRRLQSDLRKFPQRKSAFAQRTSKTPRSATTLIASIWKTLYGPLCVGLPATFGEYKPGRLSTQVSDNMSYETFSHINAVCLKLTTLGKSARALEVVVQAHWIDCYNTRVKVIAEENPQLSPTEARMAGLGEACSALGWTQKELRNRMSVWRGYKDIKDAGGWVSLVFSGAGIYGVCKYRIGFEDGLMQRLSKLQTSFEVAADTLHPVWRQLLVAVGLNMEQRYTGHPHDWVITAEKVAMPLASTYQQWDPDFSFEHLEESVIDGCWHGRDPRRVYRGDTYTCSECGGQQSEDLQTNKCFCFPSLFVVPRHAPIPVQVGRSPRGKNNGLFARCGFERGAPIGEFVGLVTKGIEGMDVMMGGHGDDHYQIFQKRVGNYTRFINHSCAPNAQFTKFIWRGVERILVVSKGIELGMEVTVDYSSSYWNNLEKVCLCGEPCCRYSGVDRRSGVR